MLPKTELTEELIPSNESKTFDPSRELSSACLTPSSVTITVESVAFLISPMISWIFTADFLLSSASFRISTATTSKPFPFSPALAASTAALRASILVSFASSLTKEMIPLIWLFFSESLKICSAMLETLVFSSSME